MRFEKLKNFLVATGILVATTLGAGIFALPYVFQKSGWLTGIFYLSVLGAAIVFAHYLYWQVLSKVQEKERLLGLIESYLGRNYFWPAFLAIVLGLLLVLVAYLILAGRFIALIFPGSSLVIGILAFWLLSSWRLFLKLRRIVALEFGGAVLLTAIIFLVFFTSGPFSVRSLPLINLSNSFFVFGPVLFALAGWTAIEPIFDFARRRDGFNARAVLAAGTFVSALLYALFVAAILLSTAKIAPDTISGLEGWPFWKLAALGWLGLFAIWNSYLPIGLEIKNALEKDLKWNRSLSLLAVFFSPLILFLSAPRFSNFLAVVGLVGGLFLAIQYIFIILVGQKVLALQKGWRILSESLVLVFLLAAVYEIYYFLK